VIWIGGNDVRDGLEAGLVDPTGALTNQILSEALTAIYTHIYHLWAVGAQDFLVLNVPDLSITPAISGFPAPIPPRHCKVFNVHLQQQPGRYVGWTGGYTRGANQTPGCIHAT
jgi:phospholipase/lecithinase/hemolysin